MPGPQQGWHSPKTAAWALALTVAMVIGVGAATQGPASTAHRYSTTTTTSAVVTITSTATLTVTPSPTPSPASTTASSTPTPSAAPAGPSSTDLPGGIPQLVIAPEDTTHPYSRSLFGDWIDADHDCQNTRAEVLISESTTPVTFTTSADCTVATGRWVSPWSGVVVTQASQVEIDHDVPLAEAWQSGAWAWTPQQRLAYANDLGFADHLNALPNSENTAKSDHDPTSWKPSLTTSWCRYARDWTTIKATYHLTADPSEWDAILTMAKTC